MATTSIGDALMAERANSLNTILTRERVRLRNFIRRRVPDADDAEDILQDVFFEFIAAYRLPEPIEQAGAWMFRVARNRIVDRFRKRREEPLPRGQGDEETDAPELDLPSLDGAPDAAYARKLLTERLIEAVEELPPEQRHAFIAHEIEGRSFKEIAAEAGVSINTMLSRKRYAVLHLRARLADIYEQFDLHQERT